MIYILDLHWPSFTEQSEGYTIQGRLSHSPPARSPSKHIAAFTISQSHAEGSERIRLRIPFWSASSSANALPFQDTLLLLSTSCIMYHEYCCFQYAYFAPCYLTMYLSKLSIKGSLLFNASKATQVSRTVVRAASYKFLRSASLLIRIIFLVVFCSISSRPLRCTGSCRIQPHKSILSLDRNTDLMLSSQPSAHGGEKPRHQPNVRHIILGKYIQNGGSSPWLSQSNEGN
jgi:hypothetical protein